MDEGTDTADVFCSHVVSSVTHSTDTDADHSNKHTEDELDQQVGGDGGSVWSVEQAVRSTAGHSCVSSSALSLSNQPNNSDTINTDHVNTDQPNSSAIVNTDHVNTDHVNSDQPNNSAIVNTATNTTTHHPDHTPNTTSDPKTPNTTAQLTSANVMDKTVECARCGNENPDLFKITVDPDTKRVTRVRCLHCSAVESFNCRSNIIFDELSEPEHIEPEQQSRRAAQLHEQTMNAKNARRVASSSSSSSPNSVINSFLVLLLTSSCWKRRPPSSTATSRPVIQNSKSPTRKHSLNRRRIHDLDDLRPGDHIAFHRNYLVWHHSIVVEASQATSEITMIHYNGAPKKLDGKLISVRLETEVVDAFDQELYRYEYDDCYDSQEVLDRAASRLGEADYGVGRNCEHFARWCKTGEEKCFQVDTVKHRLIATGVTTLGKQLEEFVFCVARYLCKEAPEEILQCGTGGLTYAAAIEERALHLFSEGTTRMASGMKWGALAGNMVVNLAIEAANFGIDVSREYAWYREGKISFDDLRQQAAKTGCECLGGLLGSTAFGLLLQLLIPIPFIGGFLGCALGSILGRIIGAGIGKQLHKVRDVGL